VSSGRSPRSQRRGVTLAAAAALTAALTAAGLAGAEDGGVGAPAPPEVRSAQCIDRCLDLRRVAETGTVELGGRDLASVTTVRLDGAEGKLDVEPRQAKSSRVKFRVPLGAQSGKPVVIDEFGNKARSPERLKIVGEDMITEVEGFKVTSAEATPSKSFFEGKRRSRVEYLFEAEQPTDVRIDVLKGRKRRLIDTVVKRDQDPFASHSAAWNGLGDDGKVAPNGKYSFEVTQLSGSDGDRAGFRYYDHKFPLAGGHTYGDGLGAGRNHQGQDIFAKRGNDVYAARGGRIQTSSYHSSAGYYIVVDGAKTGVDYVYMHLSRKGRAKKGSRVKTGERIGFNDDTGNASGCHVHFEMWSAPGWYEGGHVLSPTKPLKRWDRWS